MLNKVEHEKSFIILGPCEPAFELLIFFMVDSNFDYISDSPCIYSVSEHFLDDTDEPEKYL